MSNKTVKLIFVGDGAVGKTCCLNAYAGMEFPSSYIPTIFETYTTSLTLKGSEKLLLSLVDTAGQEDYERLRLLSYPGSHCVVLIFDLMRKVSFENACDKWMDEIRQKLPDVPIVFVGNKKDLKDKSRFVPMSSEELLKKVTELGANGYHEVSAKTGANEIKAVFNMAAGIGYQYKRFKAGKREEPPETLNEKAKPKKTKESGFFSSVFRSKPKGKK